MREYPSFLGRKLMLVYLSNPSDLRKGAGHSCLNSTQERINMRDTGSLHLIKTTSDTCLLVAVLPGKP